MAPMGDESERTRSCGVGHSCFCQHLPSSTECGVGTLANQGNLVRDIISHLLLSQFSHAFKFHNYIT
ncbi:hypothetical protein COLO4_08925 [Corchorus olitorius]|uniref:Uncharacterized protein n=1 Tax=Corchorus olitorius TaxID=93759 RepID=A0A1R3KE40_9ROSI|nr:hypothetical protein COLO4_08925 [Corchorus olitorius]